jgi:hypothetical protein
VQKVAQLHSLQSGSLAASWNRQISLFAANFHRAQTMAIFVG